jgi:D-alanine-D-alanine ligase
MARTAVLVLMGGPDAERDVSIMSGTEIAAALRRCGRYDVHHRLIDRPDADDLRAMVHETNAAVIFPALHGHWGEGGHLQQLLEEIGVAYVGSTPKAAELAMNKIATKQMLEPLGVPTPPSRQLREHDECDLDPPLVLKPVDDGSSVDLRICRTNEQIERARRELHDRRPLLMAERFIEGREVTVGILLGEALPLIEIIPAVEFYDYEAKYTRDDTQYRVNPDLSDEVSEACRWMATTAFERIGCRDLARVDFLVDDRGPWFLEINTMPGFTTHSLVPMAARERGHEMPELCAILVDTALARQPAAARASRV